MHVLGILSFMITNFPVLFSFLFASASNNVFVSDLTYHTIFLNIV